MAGPNAPYTNLDSSQVIRHVFDQTTDELRVKATFTPGSSEIIISDVDDSIKIGKGDGTTFLDINPDGSINVVGTFDAPIGAATEAKQDAQIVQLADIVTNTDNIGTSTASIDAKLTTANNLLTDIENNTDGIEAAIAALPQNNNGLIIGTEDGTVSGTQRVYVNNLRQQILATQDRQQNITYADFGTKNQRVTQIDYVSSIFPGIIARKTLSYTPVGSKYRRDSIDWSIV